MEEAKSDAELLKSGGNDSVGEALRSTGNPVQRLWSSSIKYVPAVRPTAVDSEWRSLPNDSAINQLDRTTPNEALALYSSLDQG
jgi:hypothetical protein